MNTKQIVLSIVLVDFLALNAYVISQVGYVELFAEVVSTWSGVLCLVDLALALSMVLAWMVVDARKHGLAVMPHVVATLALGSVGPLSYLIRREWVTAPRR